MTSIVKINNQDLRVREYKGQRVVTFKDIDLVHQRPEGTASRNFRQNRKYFIENVDFYDVTVEKCKSDEIRRAGFNNPRGGYLFTESGYLMLVKSFTDDLAWQVQRQLVNSYFKLKERVDQVEIKPYELKNKKYRNRPVMVTNDLVYLTGLDKSTINLYIRENNLGHLLTGRELNEFRFENKGFNNVYPSLNILYKADVLNILNSFARLEDNKEKVDSYFGDTIDNTKLDKVEVAFKLQNLSYLRRTMAMFVLNKEMRKEFDYIISKEYVKLGFLDKPCDDLGINSKEGWNLMVRVHDYGKGY